VLRASTATEVEAAFDALAGLKASGLVVAVDAFFTGQDMKSSNAPLNTPCRRFTDGAHGRRRSLSYAPNIGEGYRSVGILVGEPQG
jgi:hypothetical protein